jgi:hypothetical protein
MKQRKRLPRLSPEQVKKLGEMQRASTQSRGEVPITLPQPVWAKSQSRGDGKNHSINSSE